jgi:hypothetical protein
LETIEQEPQEEKEHIAPASRDGLYTALQWVGVGLLAVGFAGQWVYMPLGKTTDWGWSTVWGLFLSIVAANIFILLSLPSSISYVELYVRQGRPPLSALLKWIGSLALMLLVVPFVVWSLVDLSERRPIPAHRDGTLGWGVWVALVGHILNIVALRLKIRALRNP